MAISLVGLRVVFYCFVVTLVRFVGFGVLGFVEVAYDCWFAVDVVVVISRLVSFELCC